GTKWEVPCLWAEASVPGMHSIAQLARLAEPLRTMRSFNPALDAARRIGDGGALHGLLRGDDAIQLPADSRSSARGILEIRPDCISLHPYPDSDHHHGNRLSRLHDPR